MTQAVASRRRLAPAAEGGGIHDGETKDALLVILGSDGRRAALAPSASVCLLRIALHSLGGRGGRVDRCPKTAALDCPVTPHLRACRRPQGSPGTRSPRRLQDRHRQRLRRPLVTGIIPDPPITGIGANLPSPRPPRACRSPPVKVLVKVDEGAGPLDCDGRAARHDLVARLDASLHLLHHSADTRYPSIWRAGFASGMYVLAPLIGTLMAGTPVVGDASVRDIGLPVGHIRDHPDNHPLAALGWQGIWWSGMLRGVISGDPDGGVGDHPDNHPGSAAVGVRTDPEVLTGHRSALRHPERSRR